MNRFQRWLLNKRALIACLFCTSIACLLGMGNGSEISVPLDCADNNWTATSTVNAPDARGFHTAVWTGREMIIWGGFNFSSGFFNSGARYNPAADHWMATSTANAPSVRQSHTAVWTGREMIVWGGATTTGTD